MFYCTTSQHKQRVNRGFTSLNHTIQVAECKKPRTFPNPLGSLQCSPDPLSMVEKGSLSPPQESIATVGPLVLSASPTDLHYIPQWWKM